MDLIRRTATATVFAVCLAASPLALAQDASVDASIGPADGAMTSDASTADAGPSVLSLCPGAVSSLSQPIMFTRMGPVDFGPGTGMSTFGDHDTIGLDYNLLFSGTYDTGMAGHLDMRWPRPLTLTAVGNPMGGYLDVTFGLRMTATLWVAGLSFPLPLDRIIDDHEGHGRSVFTPWAWNYEGTEVLLNVSAWRTIYSRTVDVAGHGVEIRLQMRYNMRASVKTVEIGFPDRSAPTSEMRNIAVITETMPEAIFPPPRDGNLDLLTRWKPQLRYRGSLEFRLDPRCASSLDLICRAATGLLGAVLRPVETGPVVTTNEPLADPYDQMPHYSLPIAHVPQTEIDFGEVLVGQTAMNNIDLENPGQALLAARFSPPMDPSFELASSLCVEPRMMRNVPVRFTPTRTGRFTSEITIDSNGTIGAPTTVRLVGTGVTTPPRPAVRDGGRLPDGAFARVGDGGDEYYGPVIEGSCACRTVGTTRTDSRGGALLAAMALGASIAASRRRRRN